MKYRFAGKEKLLSFGPYPEISLAEARNLRDAARKLIRGGLDPLVEKKRDAAAMRESSANGFEAVAREWY